MAACDLNTLMADAACYTCMGEKQAGAIAIVVLCQILKELDPMATCDPATLAEQANGYLFLSNRQMIAAALELLCQIAASGSGVGAGVVIRTVDPVADPGVESQVWINRTSGQVWYWNDDTGAWVLLIA